MSDVKLLMLRQFCNAGRRNISQKLLMKSPEEIVELLVCEMEAKNEAYQFIWKKGLAEEFADLKKIDNGGSSNLSTWG